MPFHTTTQPVHNVSCTSEGHSTPSGGHPAPTEPVVVAADRSTNVPSINTFLKQPENPLVRRGYVAGGGGTPPICTGVLPLTNLWRTKHNMAEQLTPTAANLVVGVGRRTVRKQWSLFSSSCTGLVEQPLTLVVSPC